MLEPLSLPPNHDFETKRILYLDRVHSNRLASDVKLRALVLPKVTDGEASRTRPASRAEALMAIAPTSVMFLPRPSREAFARLAALVESLPCYWLELGTDVAAIPPAVAELAQSL